MKTIIIIIIATISTYLYYNSTSTQAPSQSIIKQPETLRLVILQDASWSNKRNGVEIISAKDLIPLFEDVSRNIYLYVGYITESSARKFISLHLPAPTFQKPIISANGGSLMKKQKENHRYAKEYAKYISDSVYYYTERKRQSDIFSQSIDSLSNYHRRHLSLKTDIATALQNVEKLFSCPIKGKSTNSLILNSDGSDSFHKTFNIAIDGNVILVNAGKNVTNIKFTCQSEFTFQSTDEALSYTLNN